jgi:Zn-dependent peptidase ImmA (M78 family)
MDEEVLAVNSGPKSAAARHAADSLLKDAKINEPPVKIKELLRFIPARFNLTIAGWGNLPDKVDALTRKEDGITIIGYSSKAPLVRQKFSVAHEIGHLYMGHLHGQSSIDVNSTDNDEVEANQFAAQLIMPPQMLRKDIKAGIKDPKDLAKRYGVSEIALWYKLNETGLWKLL